MQRRRPIGSHRQWCLGAPPAHAELGAPFAVSRDGIARAAARASSSRRSSPSSRAALPRRARCWRAPGPRSARVERLRADVLHSPSARGVASQHRMRSRIGRRRRVRARDAPPRRGRRLRRRQAHVRDARRGGRAQSVRRPASHPLRHRRRGAVRGAPRHGVQRRVPPRRPRRARHHQTRRRRGAPATARPRRRRAIRRSRDERVVPPAARQLAQPRTSRTSPKPSSCGTRT